MIPDLDGCRGCGLLCVLSTPWTRVTACDVRFSLVHVRTLGLNQGLVKGGLVYVWRRAKTDVRKAHITHRWYVLAVGVGRENRRFSRPTVDA